MVRGPVECLAAPYRFSYDGDAKVELTGLVSVEKTALLSNEWLGPRGYFMLLHDLGRLRAGRSAVGPPCASSGAHLAVTLGEDHVFYGRTVVSLDSEPLEEELHVRGTYHSFLLTHVNAVSRCPRVTAFRAH